MKIKANRIIVVLCLALTMVLTLIPMLMLTTSAEEESVTLTFDANKTNRTSFSSTKQVWEQNGITFTNDKASSSNPVADYGAPVRLYASSSITVEYPQMTKIVFNCNNSGYATALGNSISGSSVSGKVVTVTFAEAQDSFTVAKLTAQVRIDSIAVYYEAAGDPACEHTNTSTQTTPATKTEDGSEIVICDDCGYEISNTRLPATGCSVSFVVPNGVTAPDALTGKLEATMPNLEVPEGSFLQEYEFAGWATSSIGTATNERPTLYPAGSVVTLTDDTVFYAVYSYTVSGNTGSTESGWILKDSIAAGDTVVITMTKSGTVYALNSTNGSSTAPAADTTVTVADGKITSTVADSMKWTVGGTDGAWTFYKYGDPSNWLYCTNANNGVRVGTNANKTFSIDGTYLKNTATSRYLGVYNTQDWRCYTSKTTNIANQTLGFYVLVEGGVETYYTSNLLSSAGCDHSEAETVTVDATCTEPGSITTTCSCGYEKIETIEPLGHDWDEGTISTHPGCTTEGEKTFSCNNGCGETKTEAVAATGHSYEDRVCSECGDKAPSHGKYTISDYTPGEQYAKNEIHPLDSILTVETNQCHFSTELRIYSSSTYNGYAILRSATPIYGLSFNAGYKADTLNVYGLVGEEWVLIAAVDVTSSYQDYTVDFGGEAYTQIKLDVEGDQQIRIKSFNALYSKGAITNAAVSLGTDLSLMYKVVLAGGESYDNYRIEFELNGVTVEATSADGIYSIGGVPPHMMNDTITATLYNGDEVVDVLEYSIKQYLDAVIAGDFSEKAKQLANDLLIYGAAAQKHQNYNTGDLVSEETPIVDDADKPESVLNVEQIASKIDGVAFKQVGVHFNYVNRLYVTVNNTAGASVSVKINGRDAEIVDGYVFSSAIAPTGFGDEYVFELFVDGELYQTVTYSVNSYICAKWNHESGLAKALYRYAVAFANYNS